MVTTNVGPCGLRGKIVELLCGELCVTVVPFVRIDTHIQSVLEKGLSLDVSGEILRF